MAKQIPQGERDLGRIVATVRQLATETATAQTDIDALEAEVDALQAVTHREVLTAARTYYVRTDGSNSNTGLVDSAGGAFLTIQKACDVVETLDTNGQTVTIQVGTGTFTGAVVLPSVVGVSGLGQLIIQGDNATPSNVHVNVTGNAFLANGIGFLSVWDIKDLKVSGTVSCLSINGAYMRWGNLVFGASSGQHVLVVTQGKAVCLSSYHISGGGSAHLYAESNSFIFTGGKTVTFDASVTFTNFVQAIIGSTMISHGMTFTLGAFTVTGVRHSITLNAVVFTGGGGGSYFPGTTAGSTGTGGILS
jgi:hypothetical protein